MSMQLIDRLTDEHGYALLDADNFEAFVTHTPHCVLFISENPLSFPESNDVAVILPQLVREFGDRLTPAVIARPYEREVSRRYGVSEWPTLVFLRHGDYLGAVARVQNWTDYMQQFREILAGQTRQPPGVGLPVVKQAGPQESRA